MPVATSINFGDGLSVVDNGGGVITVSAGGGGGGGGSYQLDYVERTTNLTVTATAEASPTDYIVGNPITLDGSTRIKIEVFIPNVSDIAATTLLNLWDGATNLGFLGDFANNNAAYVDTSTLLSRVLTPSAGTHQYKVRAWKAGTTSSILAGPGGAGQYVPAYLRITTDSVVAPDGWISDATEAWTYVSATTFTVPGDLTVKYAKGTRIKLTQTTVKYFVVADVSFAAGNTTVTITGGSDYTLANAAVSAQGHSYDASPQGYPGWFNWTPTLGGFSGSPTVQARFSVIGRICTVAWSISGTSNGTGFTVSAPIAYSSLGMGAALYPFRATDNTSTRSVGFVEIDTANATTIALYTSATGAAWTASGTKAALVFLSYEI